MASIKPYLIVPTLIEQPTWGGNYIADLKGLRDPQVKNKKIGQSYELFEHTLLSAETSSIKIPAAIGDPSKPQQATLIGPGKANPISALIQENPVKVLGTKALKLHGNSVQILIKLTQAVGNSYQLHVKQPTEGRGRSQTAGEGRWLPKPESWYYLEPGLITLGIKPNVDWQQYKQVCLNVNKKAQDLSSQVKSKQLTVDQARTQLQNFIKTHNPQNFVNTLEVARHQAVDLSPCGIHHSWEENSLTHPQGNVVYEVQKNVYDPVSTIRAFDRGKIKDDGSIRPLNIDDYFEYIDRTNEANRAQNHFVNKKIVKKTSTYTVRQIFATENYQMQQISLNQAVCNQHTTTRDCYQHVFAYQGAVKLIAADVELTLTTGYSAFIPASIGKFTISPTNGRNATIFKTYL